MSERDRGEWIPWYCADSPSWLRLSLAARGAAEGIARKMGSRSGELHLGAYGLRGLADLLRVRWEELEPAIVELISGPHPRLLVTDDHRVLIDPEHPTRKLKGSTVRMHNKRRKDAESDEEPPPSQGVTQRHNPSPAVTPFNLISSPLVSEISVPDLPDRLPRSEYPTGRAVLSEPEPQSFGPERASEVREAPEIATASERPAAPNVVAGNGQPEARHRFAVGTSSAIEAVVRYEQAVARATGRRFALENRRAHREDLFLALNTHAPAGDVWTALDWLGPSVRDWVNAVESRFTAGYRPEKFLHWLNEGKPAKRRPAGGGPRGERQPADVGWLERRTGTEDDV